MSHPFSHISFVFPLHILFSYSLNRILNLFYEIKFDIVEVHCQKSHANVHLCAHASLNMKEKYDPRLNYQSAISYDFNLLQFENIFKNAAPFFIQ